MEFFETIMGRQFYQGTMPSIARSLEVIAKDIQTRNEQKCIVTRTNNFDKKVTLLSKNNSNLFRSEEEAKDAIKTDLITMFNDSGWEDDIVNTYDDIRSKNYCIEEEENTVVFYASPYPDPDTFVWTILPIA